MIDQKEPTLDFRSNENNIYDQKKIVNEYYKKVVLPTEKELKDHKEYLNKSLKKNYFN